MILRLITACLLFSFTSVVGSSRADFRGATESSSNSSTSSPNTTTAAQTSTVATTTTTSQSAKKTMEALAAIKTFDFSQMDSSTPETSAGNSCTNTVSTCLNDICNNGKCVMPNCSFSCECYPGYTGPFCDVPVKHHEKHHVNGDIHIHTENGDNGHLSKETSARDNGNGHIVDNGIASSDETGNGKKGTNGIHDKVDNGSGSKTELKGNGDDTTHVKSTNLANGELIANIQSPETIIKKNSSEKKQKNVKESTTVSIGATSSSSHDSRVVANGYVKGPEVYVQSDSSVVKVKTSKTEIPTDTPTVINQSSDTVTLSTVSIQDTKVRLPHESLKSSETKSKSTDALKLKSDSKKKVKNKGKANGGKQKRDKATVNNIGIDNKKQKNISKSSIAKSNHAEQTENAGTKTDHRNATRANNVHDVSDVKITIERSAAQVKPIQTGDNNNRAMGNGPAIKPDTILNKDVTSNQQKQKKSVKTNKGDQRTEISKGITTQGAQKQNKEKHANSDVPTENIIVSSDVISSASQHTETRKTMQSTVLNPVLSKIFDLIGSPNFANSVSSVKIEIITKQNETTSVEGVNSTGIDQSSVSPKGQSSKNDVSSTQTDTTKVEIPRPNVDPGPS